MRSFGQAKMVASKYLTDGLSNYYGTWIANWNIAYDNLPTGECLARLYVAAVNAAAYGISFNEPQNIKNSVFDFWIKGATNDPQIYIYVSAYPIPTYSTLMGYRLLYADGTTPTTWTRLTIDPNSITVPPATGLPNRVLKDKILTGFRSIQFYVEAMAAPPVEIGVSGFTIRRL